MDAARHTAADVARSPQQLLAAVVAGTFLLVGVLGFIPGITTNYGDMGFAGHESGAMLLGIFQVSILHNLVHLLFGVVGLLMARTAAQARLFLIGGGVIYLVLWLYGMVVSENSPGNFVPLNAADNWLHLVLGLAMLAIGFLVRTRRAGTETL